MKQDKNRTPFDDLLMAYIVKEGRNDIVSASGDKEAEMIFSKQFDVRLTDEKAKLLLSSLTQALSKDTLGLLVQKELTTSGIDSVELQKNTGLTPSLIDDIKADMVFTNSIPVKSLVKLLKLLRISVDKAQEAIDVTFEKLSVESRLFLTVPANAQPSFRKGVSSNAVNFDLSRLKSDESYLYQNKEALDKYTKRMNELYDEL